ncbi:hypothetical protein [Paenibacillus thalictri]|uniref:DUF4352 domain-containing protein n=1 Tax=Paenibacillus thalictri TaxID=2527873 RepID=A0A4Q9DN55_9BACL|nr:hypothetical protein [Paenibacillus thalictri]TBL76284.1 hypothetical protein EYB31_20005 [Paenibacillus thalictri]
MQGIHPNNMLKSLRLLLMFALVGCLAWSGMAPRPAAAGKEGVFIGDGVYFTLEAAELSKETDSQTMRFTVRLNNDGESSVDFNRYGVKVTAEGGGSYSAQLSQKAAGTVAPASAVDYMYVSKIAAGLPADQLKVTIFDRSGGGISDIGSLTVANADTLRQTDSQLVLNLSDVDSSAANDSILTLRAQQAFVQPKDGKWLLSADIAAEYSGTGSTALPSGLKWTVRDKSGKTYAAAVKMADGSALSAGQTFHILLTANSDKRPDAANLVLELSRNDAGSSVLGKLNIGPRFAVVQAGQKAPYLLQSADGLTMELGQAQVSKRSEDRQILADVMFHNGSDHTVQVPELTGSFVSVENGLTLDASLVIAADTYVASGQSTSYRLAAALPDGVSPDTLQLLVFEQKTASGKTSSGSSNDKSGSTNTNNSTSNNSDTTNSNSSTSSTNSSTSGSSGSGKNGSSASGSGNTANTGSSGSAANSSGNSGASGSTSSSGGSGNNGSTNNDASGSASIPVMAVSLNGASSPAAMVNAPFYTLGDRMALNASNSLIDKNLDVSIVELNAHTNDENGFQTVVAKFKFTNKSSDTLSLPSFATELLNSDGVSFPGSRQTTTLQQLIPNTSYVVSYSYMLPPKSTGFYTLQILDATNAAKYKVPVGAYQVAIKQTGDENPNFAQKELSFYPFNVSIDDWRMSTLYTGGAYTYKLNLIVGVKKIDDVIVDNSFSTMEFDLYDTQNRLLGSTSVPFQGTGKLISGNQTITFTDLKTEQFEFPLTIRVYETIQTATGAAKRLVATLQQ